MAKLKSQFPMEAMAMPSGDWVSIYVYWTKVRLTGSSLERPDFCSVDPRDRCKCQSVHDDEEVGKGYDSSTSRSGYLGELLGSHPFDIVLLIYSDDHVGVAADTAWNWHTVRTWLNVSEGYRTKENDKYQAFHRRRSDRFPCP